MKPLLRIRRGVGVVFIVGGLIHMGQNLFAVLWASGRLRVAVPPGLWAHLLFGQFLFLVFAGVGYLTASFKKERYFHFEALADYLAGMGGFLVVMPVSAGLIVARVLPTWTSLAPGALLALYGAGLCAGRALGWRKAADPA